MKILLIIVAVVLALPVGFIAWYRWDSATNRGFSYGYFGEFNTVSNALASIPGITITQAFANRDVTLEEFGFTATNLAGQVIRIGIGEDDRIRELFGEPLSRALTADIQSQLTSSQTNK